MFYTLVVFGRNFAAHKNTITRFGYVHYKVRARFMKFGPYISKISVSKDGGSIVYFVLPCHPHIISFNTKTLTIALRWFSAIKINVTN